MTILSAFADYWNAKILLGKFLISQLNQWCKTERYLWNYTSIKVNARMI